MYHTKGFWGLESNPNASTLNNTFNVGGSSLMLVIVVVVFVVFVVFVMGVSRGFG